MNVTASVGVSRKSYNSVKTIDEAVLCCCSNSGIVTRTTKRAI